jgi:hypothetical protein
MNHARVFFLSVLALAVGCESNLQEKYPWHPANEVKQQDSLSEKESFKYDNLVIECDTLYGKDITLHLDFLGKTNDDLQFDFVFYLIEQKEGETFEIFRDTVECTVPVVEFVDYNNDKVKDILIQNYSGARSNWTYNLFLVKEHGTSIRKIRGFNQISNPNYLPQYGLIDNFVMSGRDWTSFYKITGDTIKDFGIVIYHTPDEEGDKSYLVQYDKAIKKILKTEGKR